MFQIWDKQGGILIKGGGILNLNTPDNVFWGLKSAAGANILAIFERFPPRNTQKVQKIAPGNFALSYAKVSYFYRINAHGPRASDCNLQEIVSFNRCYFLHVVQIM